MAGASEGRSAPSDKMCDVSAVVRGMSLPVFTKAVVLDLEGGIQAWKFVVKRQLEWKFHAERPHEPEHASRLDPYLAGDSSTLDQMLENARRQRLPHLP